MLRRLEASLYLRTEGVSPNDQKERRSGSLGQVPSYSHHRLVSQSAMLKKICTRV